MDTLATGKPIHPKAAREPSVTLKRLLARLPEAIRDSFTADQLAALDDALAFENPKAHPLNLRVTLFNWAYLVILAGRERRSPARRVEERKQHPLHSPGNIAFLIGVAIVGLFVGHSLHTLLIGN